MPVIVAELEDVAMLMGSYCCDAASCLLILWKIDSVMPASITA